VFTRWRLPRLRLRTSNCSLLLTYIPRKDETLSRPGWLTYSGRFTHISGHPSAAGWAQDRKFTCLPLYHPTNKPVTSSCSLQYISQLYILHVLYMYIVHMHCTNGTLYAQFADRHRLQIVYALQKSLLQQPIGYLRATQWAHKVASALGSLTATCPIWYKGMSHKQPVMHSKSTRLCTAQSISLWQSIDIECWLHSFTLCVCLLMAQRCTLLWWR